MFSKRPRPAPTNYLIDVVKSGHHVALITTFDSDFVATLEKLLAREGYQLNKSASPAAPPLRNK